jgi:hypothetical protein
MKILEFFMNTVGFIIIWILIDYKRPNDKIKPYSSDWWTIFFFVIVAGCLISIRL